MPRGSRRGKQVEVESSPSPSDAATSIVEVAHVEQPSEVTRMMSVAEVSLNNIGAKKMAADGGVSIMEFSVDLQEQEAPPPLPVGQYPAEIISATSKVSQTSGNTYAAIQFRINSDDYPADYVDGDPDGTVLNFNRVVLEDSPQARYRIRKFLEAVGGRLGRSLDLSDLLGLTGVVEIVHDEFEGEKRAQIKRVIPA